MGHLQGPQLAGFPLQRTLIPRQEWAAGTCSRIKYLKCLFLFFLSGTPELTAIPDMDTLCHLRKGPLFQALNAMALSVLSLSSLAE